MASSASSSKSASPEPQIVEKKLKRKRKSEGTTTKEKKEKKEKKAKEVVEEEEAVVEGAVEMDVDAEAEAKVDDNAADSEAEDNDDDENADKSTEDPDVPVLSHAERRRQKKEAKLAAARKAELVAQGVAVDADEDAEGASVKKRKLKDGSAKTVAASASANVRKNSVWVGNMSYKTQQDDLRKFFAGVGEITRVNMPMKAPSGPGVKPENRGFAYVDFATPEAKAAAIARSEQPLVGRKLLIKDGDSFEGRPAPTTGGDLVLNDAALLHKTHSKTAQKILKAQKQPPASTLFMGNLGFETTDETIRQLLDAHRPGNKKGKSVVKTKDEEKKDGNDEEDEEKEKAAKDAMDTDEPKAAETEEQKPKDDWIRQIRMGTFEDTGLCKGFAFIDFTSVENATAALINPKNHHLNGRNLLVEYASPDAVRRGLNKFRPPGERTNTANQGKKRPHRTERLQARAALRGDTGAGTSTMEEGGEDKREVSERPKRPWEHKESSGATRDGMRHKGPKSRPKPGAALALAKRESVAIVASEGKKITF